MNLEIYEIKTFVFSGYFLIYIKNKISTNTYYFKTNSYKLVELIRKYNMFNIDSNSKLELTNFIYKLIKDKDCI
jgi:hypothetical protein